MALGEAFINVRADVKPFAKDLEKGIREILAAAEKKIAANSGAGRSIGKKLEEEAKRGLGKGVEDGMDEGFRRGAKKATGEATKFIATLADFLDDGLSAIPPQAKAAIVIAIAGAAVIIGPLLAGAISAAIIAGGAVGAAALGTILAFRLDIVKRQFTALGDSVLKQLTFSATPLVQPLLRAAETINNAFGGISKDLTHIFAQVARDIDPLVQGILGFIDQANVGFVNLAKASKPVIDALAAALPELGKDIAAALTIIADTAPEASVALYDFIRVIGLLIGILATLVAALAKAYYYMRVFAAFATGDFQQAYTLIALRAHAASEASGQLDGSLSDLNYGLSQTASDALAAQQAIGDLAKSMTQGLDATIDYEQAIDDLNESVKGGNKDFRVTEENGRKNLRLLKTLLDANVRQRDAAVANASQTGQSIEEINAKYEAQIAEIQKVIGKNGNQNQTVKDLLASYRELPDQVAVEVQTPGLDSAIANFRSLGRAAAKAAQAAVNAINTAGGGHGLKTATQYALGGIVDKPTAAVIGEAGYREAVIPDPSVMPGRAMQLSNQIGLTSMIAKSLGAGRQVINVYLGTERLDERVDYRIGYNNQLQATAMAYGPRS